MAVALCHAPWLRKTNAMPGMTDLKLICFHQCSLLQLRSADFAVLCSWRPARSGWMVCTTQPSSSRRQQCCSPFWQQGEEVQGLRCKPHCFFHHNASHQATDSCTWRQRCSNWRLPTLLNAHALPSAHCPPPAGRCQVNCERNWVLCAPRVGVQDSRLHIWWLDDVHHLPHLRNLWLDRDRSNTQHPAAWPPAGE